MKMRKVRFQFTMKPTRPPFGISTSFIYDLEINFLIDGSEDSDRKITEMLRKKFYKEKVNQEVPPEEWDPLSYFHITGWSVFESKQNLPITTLEEILRRETGRHHTPRERKSGGQGPQ